MPGAPPGGEEPPNLEPADVWTVIGRILDGKPVTEKKSGGQGEKDSVDSGQPSQPPQPSPTGPPAAPGMEQPPMAGPPGAAPAPPQHMMGAPMM